MVDDLTCGIPAAHVLNCLREVTKVPVYIGHTPLAAARVTRENKASDLYLSGINTLNEKHYHKFGAEMIGQPLSTIVNGRNTAPEYSWGVPKLSAVNGLDNDTGSPEDNTHMDAAFGSLWLEDFFTKLP